LCHFTKSSNLAHILSTGEIRSRASLEQSIDGYRPTDGKRWDGHLEHICCGVEYPNVWYLEKARERDPVFLDWVVLVLDVELLGVSGVKFCSHNAARRGASIQEGVGAFSALYAERVEGRVREDDHPDWWPTDDQAEVLVPGPVPLSAIRAVIVEDEVQAELEAFRLKCVDVPIVPPFSVAPALFHSRQLSSAVRRGRRPSELPAWSSSP
jgi:hypothetical protein